MKTKIPVVTAPQAASEPAGSQQRLAMRRPVDATHDGLRKCVRWLDACQHLGWAEEAMPSLEALFWQYHDHDGNKKPHSDKGQP